MWREESKRCFMSALSFTSRIFIHFSYLKKSPLLQRLFLAHVLQILTLTTYTIFFCSNDHKLKWLCKREMWWTTFSCCISKTFFCQLLSTMSSAFYCFLWRKDEVVILFMQACSTLLFEDSSYHIQEHSLGSQNKVKLFIVISRGALNFNLI